MTDKQESWHKIIEALQEIIEEADLIEGMEGLSSEQLDEHMATIKTAAQKVRSAAHDYMRPDLEEEVK